MWLASLKNSLGLALALACACTLKPAHEPQARLFLASSLLPLKSSLEQLAPSDMGLDLQFLSSSMIATQVAEGAPCDGVIVADREWQEYLVKKGVVKSQERPLATNALVLAGMQGPTQNKALPELLAKLKGERQLIIADPDYVPLGRYSHQALKGLGLWDELKPKLIHAHSAYHARVMLEQGAAPYAMLFKSDMRAPQIYQVAEVDPKLHKPVSYVFLRCQAAKAEQAAVLESLLFSPEFAAMLTEHNFGLPP